VFSSDSYFFDERNVRESGSYLTYALNRKWETVARDRENRRSAKISGALHLEHTCVSLERSKKRGKFKG
jgi:hypothetical protein